MKADIDSRIEKLEYSREVRVALAMNGKIAVEELDDEELRMIIADLPPELNALYEQFFTLLTDRELECWDKIPLEDMRPEVRAVAEQIVATEPDHPPMWHSKLQ